MEFDQHSSSRPEFAPEESEKKETRKKRKKRAPRHVPLQLEAESAEQSPRTDEKKTREKPVEPKPEVETSNDKETEIPPVDRVEGVIVTDENIAERPKKKRKKRKKTPAKPSTETVAEEPIPTQKSSEAVVDQAVERSAEKAIRKQPEKPEQPEAAPEKIEPVHETILPLETKEAEGELFVSERWRRQPEQQNEDVTGTNAAEAKQDAARPPASPQPARTETTLPPQDQEIAQAASPVETAATERTTFAPAVPTKAAERQRYIERSLARRNFVVGLLIGGVIEHVRHRRREKKHQRAHVNALKQTRNATESLQERLYYNEQKAERTKTELEKNLERLRRKTPAPSVAERPRAAAASGETGRDQAKQPETTTHEAAKRAAEAAEAVRQASIEHQKTEEIKLPSDRRLETSAWHRIEVDKKTGKAVETPTLAYGEEFKHEQHQELLRRQIDEASESSDKVRQQYTSLGSANNPSQSERPALPEHATPDYENEPTGAQKVQDRAREVLERTSPVDIGLAVILGIIIWAIIAAL